MHLRTCTVRQTCTTVVPDETIEFIHTHASCKNTCNSSIYAIRGDQSRHLSDDTYAPGRVTTHNDCRPI